MKYKIEKHANGKYLVTVSKVPYAYDEQYKTYNDLYFHDRFRDVKKFLNMEEQEGVMEVQITFKADLETLEITLAIIEENPYYYTLSLESIINEIKTMENK